MFMLPTRPMPRRSSGINAMETPRLMISRGLSPSMRLPSIKMLPPDMACRPAMASQRARWPDPATPATPRISPACRRKLTSCSSGWPSAPVTESL